jgi:TldD protein
MKDLLEWLRDEATRRGVDFMDVRAVEREGTGINLQDGKADKVNQFKTYGVGVRVLIGRAWGFASTDSYDRRECLDCLESAIAMAKASQHRVGEMGRVAPVEPVIDTLSPTFEIDPRSVPVQKKMDDLSRFEQEATRRGKEKFVNTTLFYGDNVMRETICNTIGTLIDQQCVRTSIGTMMVAKEGNVRQWAFEHKAHRGGYELIERLTPQDVSVKAADRAISLLSAKRAPSGKFTVVFHPSVTGLLTHEALGHNAEADLVLSGQSIIEGKVGTKIASDCITIIDDASFEGSWGSYRYDSEGVPAIRRVLIERGILKGYMHNLETAAKMDVTPTGSGRAQDFWARPIVRMSNTFIAPGEMSLDELLKDIDVGILLKGGHWGYVFCERGQYTCHAGEGWMIRNGEICEHLRDVSICGLTLETLMKADAVSKDFEMDMAGTCGKGGQGMPINAGGPYVRVRDVVVGGQEGG